MIEVEDLSQTTGLLEVIWSLLFKVVKFNFNTWPPLREARGARTQTPFNDQPYNRTSDNV